MTSTWKLYKCDNYHIYFNMNYMIIYSLLQDQKDIVLVVQNRE